MKDRKKSISISISKKLLFKIERDIIGKSRSEKITKCVEEALKLYKLADEIMDTKDIEDFTISELKILARIGGYREDHNPLKKVEFIFEKR